MDSRVQSALQMVSEEFAKPLLTVTNVAQRVGLSRVRFERLLSQEAGQTFRQCVRELRLAEGKRLLVNRALEIKEVAYLVGYTSAAGFTRAFDRRFGLTPSDFRRRIPAEIESRRR